MLPAAAQAAADEFVGRLDRALPGRLEAFYVVGSAALGAFRPGRSDLDFVAVLAGEPHPGEVAGLRRVHRGSCVSAARSAVRAPRHRPSLCNGVYVRAGDIGRSPLTVVPVAAHVSTAFAVGRGFDVNPVTWHTLGRCGVAVRGPDPRGLDVHDDDAELRGWTLGNLNGYWAPWAAAARGHGWTGAKALTRRSAAWGVLGAPRLLYTLETGEIATKEQAAAYARDVLAPRWHALLEEALAHRRGEPARAPYRDPLRRRRHATDFVVDAVGYVARRRFPNDRRATSRGPIVEERGARHPR